MASSSATTRASSTAAAATHWLAATPSSLSMATGGPSVFTFVAGLAPTGEAIVGLP